MVKVMSDRSKKSLSLRIHPAAKPAFDFFNNQQFLFDKTSFDLDILSTLNNCSTLYVIEKQQGEALIVSGFEYFSFDLSTIEPDKYIIIVSKNLSDEDISLHSWTNVLRTLFSSLDRQQIELFRENLNLSAPKEIIQILSKRNKISRDQFAKWSSLSKNGLTNQKKRAQKVNCTLPVQPLSIFEQLVQEEDGETHRN